MRTSCKAVWLGYRLRRLADEDKMFSSSVLAIADASMAITPAAQAALLEAALVSTTLVSAWQLLRLRRLHYDSGAPETAPWS